MAKINDYEKCDHVFLSLGAGIQSSALLIMSCLDRYEVPRVERAYFADTGDEPQFVYDHLDRMEEFADNHGMEIKRVQKGVISEDLEEKKDTGERLVSIPAWTVTESGRIGPLRRQCTREYKIEPIQKQARLDLGYEPGQVIKGKELIGMMLGITIDEIQRAKQNTRTPYIINLFPFLDLRMRRNDCLEVFDEVDIPRPKKSSCSFCPYHNDSYWRDLYENHPEDFQHAVEVDEMMRDMTMKGVDNPCYLHKSGKPLKELPFLKNDDEQINMFAQLSCDGFCDI